MERINHSNPAHSPMLNPRRHLTTASASNLILGNNGKPRSRSNSRSRSVSRSRRLSNDIIPLSPKLTPKLGSATSLSSAAHNINSSINNINNNNTNINSIDINDIVFKVNLDNTLPLDYFKQDILSVLKSLKIPKWRKIDKSNYKSIKLDRISGAMTNCVYKLTYLNYYPLLLRIYGEVENIIDRNSELITLIRLSRKNIGPKLLGCFNNGRFEEFLNNSVTLNKSQIKDSKISRMIARRMKEFHYGVDLTNDEINTGPKSWYLIEKWIKIIDEIILTTNPSIDEQINVFFTDWQNYKKFIKIYKDWLFSHYGSFENIKENLKFCHNDTQYGNLLFYSKSEALSMLDDDEIDTLSLNFNSNVNINKETTESLENSQLPIVTDINFKYDTSLTVIDFEYAGQNLPAYDITNHFSEWMYDYHDPEHNYRTNHLKYPSVEERINLLNQYVNYIPGSTTPGLHPLNTSKNKSSISITNTNNNNNKRPVLSHSHSVVSMKINELPTDVINLYNETIYWRSTSSIFWSLWAIISKGNLSDASLTTDASIKSITKSEFEHGPNGETYTIKESDGNGEDSDDSDDFLNPTLDDEFNHLKYALGKNGILIGDLLQFDLITKDDVQSSMFDDIKYLDAQVLPIN